LRSSVITLVLLAAIAVPVNATVTTIGDVDPGGAAVQPDPWTVGDKLYVGKYGSGTLSAESGGVVSNTFGYIGHELGATGIATVTGSGSQWNNSDWLAVGDEGSGTLNIEAGGVVSNTTGFIGNELGAMGTATVTGAGSQWTNSSSLYIGGSSSQAGGSGTLSLNDSGLVTVSNTIKLWAGGTVNLNGGILGISTLDLTKGTFNMLDGVLYADKVIGDLDVQGGVVAPGKPGGVVLAGANPGILTISSDYTQGATATLAIELGETSDQLLVDGNASLDGELNVELLGGFTPDHGDQFPVITAGTRDGEFDAIEGIQVAADLTLAPIYDYADHIGLMLIAAAPGDANFDGLVDVADLGIVGENFNAADMQWDTGDFNLDGMTDVADLGILGTNWSAGQIVGGVVDLVPEPTTLSLLAMSVLAVGRRRR